MDLILCTLALPIVIPVAAGIALWIKLNSAGPVLFRQERLGAGKRPFTMYKFRSMLVTADPGTHWNHVRRLFGTEVPMEKLDPDDKRLIPGGGLLRASCMDELPQIINVFRGEMSLVGPRPCLPEEEEFFPGTRQKRFYGLPGLTGSWQVNGKNRLTFRQMVDLDCRYFEKRSLRKDVGIMLKTPSVILEQITECRERKKALSLKKPTRN